MMNNDIEDLLREGMDRFTTELRAPAGLTRLVRRRRRRRLATRTATGVAATLAAGAVAFAAVVVPSTSPGADPTAYVVQRISSALSAAGPEIAQMTITSHGVEMPGGTIVALTAEEWSYGDQWRWVTNGPTGQANFDEGFRSSVYTLVNYLSRTWARQAVTTPGTPGPGPVRHGCEAVVEALTSMFQPGLPGPGGQTSSLPTTAATALRSAVSCGTLTVAGRERVDGIEAIKLTSSHAGPVTETIWVSPGTYLPVRATIRSAYEQAVPWLTADITWLPPSARNLAKLTVPIPAGFRQVRFGEATVPARPRIPGTLPPNITICLAPGGPACKGLPAAYGAPGPGPGSHAPTVFPTR